MMRAAKEFTTNGKEMQRETLCLLPPKGKGQCIANLYKGKEQKAAPPFKALHKEGRGFSRRLPLLGELSRHQGGCLSSSGDNLGRYSREVPY